MKEIMYVCTGNTCRSPMAEAITKKLLGEDRVVISRGIAVGYEDSANDKAIQVMESKGVDMTKHKSKQFRIEDVTEEMVILTMTLRHKLFILTQFPQLESQVKTLMEYADSHGDVVDPYGGSLETYMACAEQLEEIICHLIDIDRL